MNISWYDAINWRAQVVWRCTCSKGHAKCSQCMPPQWLSFVKHIQFINFATSTQSQGLKREMNRRNTTTIFQIEKKKIEQSRREWWWQMSWAEHQELSKSDTLMSMLLIDCHWQQYTVYQRCMSGLWMSFWKLKLKVFQKQLIVLPEEPLHYKGADRLQRQGGKN